MKIKYKLVSDTLKGKGISAYVVIHPDGRHVATLHVYYSARDTMRIDIFEKGILVNQTTGPAEDYPFSQALGETELADIRLYEKDSPVTAEDSPLRPFETEFYASGLGRLKIFGYQVIKAI